VRHPWLLIWGRRLTRAHRLHYAYQQQALYLDAVATYCETVNRFAMGAVVAKRRWRPSGSRLSLCYAAVPACALLSCQISAANGMSSAA
jgi:hypothetical protein